MNFVQLEYPIFLLLVLIIVWATSALAWRKVIVLGASVYFYAYWDYRFLILLASSTMLDFGIGIALGNYSNATLRRVLLGFSIVGNLGVLGFFKYYNFFVESAQELFSGWGLHGGTLSILLPIGISFYTFQTLSYSIDVYRRTLSPCRNLLDFSIYVMFFPQLVAGPIVRASEFLPQLNHAPAVALRSLYPGLIQILRGFVKKVLIADQLGTFVDPVFAAPQVFSALTILLAIVAYAGQIYGDFAGYTDIAIGSARLLGFRLPENFRHPYLAASIGDFWHRWHITLSTWLRDYVYIPLGGNRRGSIRTYINLMVTMLLGGLWHGAAWNFVAWGAWHGTALCVERWFSRGGTPQASVARGVVTFLVVLFGWTLFRCSTMSQWTMLVGSLFFNFDGFLWLPPLPLIALTLLIGEHWLWMTRWRDVLRLGVESWLTPWIVGFAIAALVLFAPQDAKPFVYFQF